MKPLIDLAVFDMAGTTVHDPGAVNVCLRDALAEFGVVTDAAAANAVMGLPKRDSIRLLLTSADRRELLGQVEAIHDHFARHMREFYARSREVREIAGATATFQRLRAGGIKVALNTGFGRDIADAILTRLGWVRDGRIDASICSDEVARGRPHPDMIRALMEQFGIIDARRVAKVGDTPLDLDEGHNAGCVLVVGVTRGSHSRAQLERCRHTHLIETVADFPALVFGPDSK